MWQHVVLCVLSYTWRARYKYNNFILLFYYFPVVSNEVSAFLTSFSHFHRVLIMYFPTRFISFRCCIVMIP